MTLLFVYIFLAIGISFLCSILEAVLLSITPSYVRALADENEKVSARIDGLKSRVDQPLAAILSLNTIAHTAGAAGVGAQAAAIWGDTAVGIASAIMTLLVLVFSEIIPKTLGANHWRTLAPSVSLILVWMVNLLRPFVWLSDKITLLFSKKQDDAKYVRSEIEAMAMFGSQVGALQEQESEIIQGLLQFRHIPLRKVMTPRNRLFKVQKDMTVEEYGKQHGSVSFSRVLVFNEDPDDIIGFVLKSDIMLANARLDSNFKVSKLLKPLYVVSENMSLPALFTNMLQQRLHISLVIDEYGDVQGIVTLEDLLETLLQVHIFDEKDNSNQAHPEVLKKWQHLFDEDGHFISDDNDENDSTLVVEPNKDE